MAATAYLPFLMTHRRQIVALAAKRSPKRLKYSTPRFTKEGEFVSIEVDPSGADAWKLEPVIDLLKQGAVGVIPTDTVYAIACDCKNPSAVERLRRFLLLLYILYPFPSIPVTQTHVFVGLKRLIPPRFGPRAMASLTSSLSDHWSLFLLLWQLMQPLSILCRSLRDIDTYTMGFPRGDAHGHANVFRAVKQCLPGPYSFILTASKELPKQCVGYGTTSVKYASRKNVGVRIPDDAICQAILQEMDAPLICTSVKGPKQNQWILDPTAIADIYGPEGLDFVIDGGVRVADPSTIVDMTGPYPKVIREGKGPLLSWMVVEDDESSLGQDLTASGT